MAKPDLGKPQVVDGQSGVVPVLLVMVLVVPVLVMVLLLVLWEGWGSMLTPGLNPANSTLHGCFIHHLEMGFPAIYITKPPWHGSHAGFQVWESESPTGYLSVRSFQKYESQKENHHDRM